jgi:hypothetical protein
MARDTLEEGQNRFWYGYQTYAHRDELPPEESWPWSQTLSNNAFKAGARWAIRQSSDLSPHIAKFIEMMILLGLIESDEEFFPAARNVPIEVHAGEDSGVVVEYRDDIPF